MVDPDRPLKIIVKVYKFYGLWHDGPWKRFNETLGFVVHFFITTPFIFALVLNIFLVDNLAEMIQLMYISFCEIALWAKVMTVYWKNAKVVSLKRRLEENFFLPRNVEEEEITWEVARSIFPISYFYYGVSLSSVCVTTYVWPAMVLASGLQRCPFNQWFFGFQCHQGGWFFWFLYCYQVWALTMHCLLNITTDILLPFFVNRIVGQLKVLRARIESIGEVKEFLECVKVHQEITTFTKEVEEVFSLPVFVQVMMSSMTLCVTAFQLMTFNPLQDPSSFLGFTLFMICMFFQIFIPCHYGSLLHSESSVLSFSVYSSNWLETTPKFRKLMLFFMLKTSRPLVIMATHFFPIELRTFVSVMNSSYSWFAFLKNSQK